MKFLIVRYHGQRYVERRNFLLLSIEVYIKKIIIIEIK
jgi:hypothetical protein